MAKRGIKTKAHAVVGPNRVNDPTHGKLADTERICSVCKSLGENPRFTLREGMKDNDLCGMHGGR